MWISRTKEVQEHRKCQCECFQFPVQYTFTVKWSDQFIKFFDYYYYFLFFLNFEHIYLDHFI